MTEAQQRQSWKPIGNPWLIAIAVTSASFMEVLDTTIVNVALPHIAGSLSASADDATWALTSYLVANGIVLPISGWFGSMLGRKRYFLICIGMFTVCSFLCGVAQSLPQLILFRLMQGFFGGGLQPNQQSIILDTFPPERRGAAFSLTAIATIVAPVLGPTLGGLITDNMSWRWVFLINVPIGMLALVAVASLVQDPPWAKISTDPDRRRVDFIGISLIAIGIGCAQIVLDRGEDLDWFQSSFIQGFAMAALVGIVLAVLWLLNAKRPVVSLRPLANRNFAVGVLMIACMAMVLYSSSVLIPQLAQQQLHYTATYAGLLLSPGAVSLIVLIPIVGWIMPKIQTRQLIAFGFISLGCALLYATSVNAQADFFTLALIRITQTCGMAFLFVPISTIAYSTLKPELNRDATSLFTMFRNLAGSVGISGATALVTEHTQTRMAHLVNHLNPFDPGYVDTLNRDVATLISQGQTAAGAMASATGLIYRNLQTQAAVLAYLDVFQICAIVTFAVAPLTLLMSASKSGRGRRIPEGH